MSGKVIFFREESDHTGFLFNPDNCASIQLNPTAVAIYKLLKQNVPVQEIPDRLAEICASPLPPEAAKEIEAFISQLQENNWI